MSPRLLVTAVILLTSHLALADQKLSCQIGGPRLEIALVREAFIPFDSVTISEYDASAVRPFLEGAEDQTQILSSQLVVTFAENSCAIGLDASGSIGSCHREGEQLRGVDRSNISYSALTTSPAGDRQEITVTRNLRVLSADLKLVLVDGPSDLDQSPSKRVKSSLTVVAEVAGKSRTLTYSRDEGEWTDRTDRSNYDRCVIGDGL